MPPPSSRTVGRPARYGDSGLTVARFCDREGAAIAIFHYWQRKLRVPSLEKAAWSPARFDPVEVTSRRAVTIPGDDPRRRAPVDASAKEEIPSQPHLNEIFATAGNSVAPLVGSLWPNAGRRGMALVGAHETCGVHASPVGVPLH